MQDKSVLKLDADGNIVRCAKGLDVSACGYAPGAKACGKCGAIAVMAKMNMEDDEDEYDDEDDEEMMKSIMAAMEDDGEDFMPTMKPKKSKKMPMMMMDEDEEEDEEGAVSMPMPKRKPMVSPAMDDEDEEDMEYMEDEDEMSDEDNPQALMRMRKKMRMRRMNSMGYKSADIETQDIYMCQFERKVYEIGQPVCDSCPGGCVPEGVMPGILEIEGIAEEMFSGKVLDSGYSDDADLFVVDLERKDGKPIEIFFDGETAEVMGWHMLNNAVLEVKSALQNQSLISFQEAANIATKSVFGEVVAVEPDVFEGYDAYAVEIEGIDGKSYDVFVSLDGEILGYDEYTLDEAEAIEAEAAEIALKRAYSEESRMDLAKRGMALPDGSYPIRDEADLRNAIQAYGRAKDKQMAKAHIMKRAMDLGLEDLIPMNWVPEGDKKKAQMEEKSEEESFLADLLEFEMLATEHGINEEDK